MGHQNESFYELTPDLILDAVENGLDLARQNNRATGRCMPLNSIENRVYEIFLEDGTSVVAKFYRPGRWSADEIFEEHDFLEGLTHADLPVVSPLSLPHVESRVSPKFKTLGKSKDSILFCVFPKKMGRSVDELGVEDLKVLGRYLARLHNVGETRFNSQKINRPTLGAQNFIQLPLKFLTDGNFLSGPQLDRYAMIANALIELGQPQLEGLKKLQLHGDCHWGNLLWSQGNPLFVDFDDTLIGPAVQDLWMVVGGRDPIDKKNREILIEAYQEFRPFAQTEFRLIEYLRALRIVHYSYWIARRWEDPAFKLMFPDFGSERWWQEEISALSDIHYRLIERENEFGNND